MVVGFIKDLSFVQVATTMHWRLGLLGRTVVEMAGVEGTGTPV
jgi:hypothetical protein